MENDLIIGLGFFVAGSFVVIQGGMTISRGIDSEHWPKVNGEIVETGIQTSTGNKGGVLYSPLVRFRFEYLGHTYVCDNISVGGTFASSFRFMAQNAISKYRSKQTVRVWVCPEDPTLSVLKSGISKSAYFMILVGLVFFAIGVKIIISQLGVDF